MENLRSFILNVFSSLAAAGIIALARNKGPWFMALVRALAIHKRISRWLINRAVLRLPVYARSRLQEEWLAHLNELGPFAALRHAISCTLRTANLIMALSNETRPRNRIKSLTNFAGAAATIVVCVLSAPGVYFESSLPPAIVQAPQQSAHGPIVTSSVSDTVKLNDGVYKPLSSLTGTAVSLNDGIYKPLAPLTVALNLNDGIYKPLSSLTGTAVNLSDGIYKPSSSLPAIAADPNDGVYKPLTLISTAVDLNAYKPSSSLTAIAADPNDGVYKPLTSLTGAAVDLNAYNPSSSPIGIAVRP